MTISATLDTAADDPGEWTRHTSSPFANIDLLDSRELVASAVNAALAVADAHARAAAALADLARFHATNDLRSAEDFHTDEVERRASTGVWMAADRDRARAADWLARIYDQIFDTSERATIREVFADLPDGARFALEEAGFCGLLPSACERAKIAARRLELVTGSPYPAPLPRHA